ncbi:unnamed protein product [Spirodela intermedia]|uniref:FLZ-type domain-containing protein n=1 Tax=Spirodela intermedia TaxID=51605 RepID=A0A7I8JP08_SPIIN|nr:unnamed protein product [Spirodela intermedia]CAA6671192.1 unnamed protein product [Spirodela intermedia]
MSDGGQDHSHGGAAAIAMTPRSALPRRSEPIPIFSARSGAIGIPRRDQRIEEEEDEQEREMMSESYTCVISHVEGSTVRKRVYLDDGGGDLWGCCPGDFLSRCFRCRRALHGIDIFIYRGDKAFCSAECRSRQIASEEQGRSKYPLDAPTALDCSPSPCSAPLLFPPASPPRSRKLRR